MSPLGGVRRSLPNRDCPGGVGLQPDRGEDPVTMLLQFCLTVLLTPFQGSPTIPETAVNELLEADRKFSRDGASKNTVEAISATFADDVAIPTNVFIQGKAQALVALKANPDNLESRIEWSPIRGGISADGLHGFTFGYMKLTKADKSVVPFKYLAYWVKGPDGWRVAAYRRPPRPEGQVSSSLMEPSLPERMVPPSTEAARTTAFGEGLAAAEKAFSDEAQKIGIGAAFAKHGRPDAVNMGGPKEPGFVIGSEAIGRAVGEGSPTDRSEVEWSADRVLVASSGDLGITFGIIRVIKPEPGRPATFPFFTIWRRENTSQPWRYIAE